MTEHEWVARCVSAAADLALFFVGQPEGRMMAALAQSQENLKTELAEIFGNEVAGMIAKAFVETVAQHKAEIEAKSVGQLQSADH